MKWKRLSEGEVDDLLATYRSQRKQLNFQLGMVQQAIKDLKDYRVRKEELDEARKEARKNAPSTYKRKPGRRKKRTVVGGYKLNPWDQFIVDTITAKGELMTKSELVEARQAWGKENNAKTTAKETEMMITRSLNKLGGKRGDIGKHRTGIGRGLHYGIGDWFFANNGKLKGVNKDKIPKQTQ